LASDLITLRCPSCGGSLSFSPNTITLICQHCTSEFMVRGNANGFMLESSTRCPVCNRNDQVRKVSAIVSEQTSQVTGRTTQNSTITYSGHVYTAPVQVPYSGSQTTKLAEQLAPPVSNSIPETGLFPNRSEPNGGTALIVIGFIILISTIFLGIVTYSNSRDNTCAVLSILLALFSIYLIFRGLHNNDPEIKAEKILVLKKKYKEQLDAYSQKFYYSKSVAKSIAEAWLNWSDLYYCFRDDIVFLPGKNNYAAVCNIREYIHSNPHEIPSPEKLIPFFSNYEKAEHQLLEQYKRCQ
jgi:hypothetical protein